MFYSNKALSMLRTVGSSRVALGAAASLLLSAEIYRQSKEEPRKQCCSGSALTDQSESLPLLSRLSPAQFPDIWRPDMLCQCQDFLHFDSGIRRTIRKIRDSSSKATVNSRYLVHWDAPLGEGAYGTVYAATNRSTGEKVALKKISKSFTDDVGFQQEMEAFLHLREAGGHPNICRLHENFEEGSDYYLILDLISGGEMFDHLIRSGAYSEADAARLVREVASALAFIHGLGCVHGDLKPENLMLSTENVSDAVVKLIDFGCAQIKGKDVRALNSGIGNTTAYCPPEVLAKSRRTRTKPSLDMWSLGVIVYIMLIGVHPFDLSGESTDQEIARRIIRKEAPPLGNSEYTNHLSESAVGLIKRLLAWDPKERITAEELLQHPWVRGETASQSKMADSDTKLSKFRRFKSKIELQTFEQMFNWANQNDRDDVTARTSLIERSFRKFDAEQKGFITAKDLGASAGASESDEGLSLSAFSDLLSDHLENVYFRKDQVVYREGEEGNEMFFINSGRVEISTRDGFKVVSKQGDFVGEGALLSPDKVRSATVQCITPVHAIKVTREYFEKYLAASESALSLKMREQDKGRALNRTKMILRNQNDVKPLKLHRGDHLYQVGDEGKELYILKNGKVEAHLEGHTVFTLNPGDMSGQHSLIVGRPHGTSATCVSKTCKLLVMPAQDFHSVLRETPKLKESLEDVSLRREFQKAVVFETKKPFPTTHADLRQVFDAVDLDGNGTISLDEIRKMIKKMDPNIPDTEISDIMKSLDIDESGAVDFAEFTNIFGIGVSSKDESSPPA